MVSSCKLVSSVLMAPLLLASPVVATGNVTTPTGGFAAEASIGDVPQEVWDMYSLISQIRAQGYACSPNDVYPPNPRGIYWNCGLWKSSTYHSEDMANQNYFNHESLDGRQPFQRATAQGEDLWSENIAAGVADPAGAMEQFKKSLPHCKNLMDPEVLSVGVGRGYNANSQWKYYWTQDFGINPNDATSCYPTGGLAQSPTPVASTTEVVEEGSVVLGDSWTARKHGEKQQPADAHLVV